MGVFPALEQSGDANVVDARPARTGLNNIAGKGKGFALVVLDVKTPSDRRSEIIKGEVNQVLDAIRVA